MKDLRKEMKEPCCCTEKRQEPKRQWSLPAVVAILLGGVAVWGVIYSLLEPFSRWFSHDVLGLGAGSHLGEAVAFFVYDTPKVFMLLVLVVFFVGIARSFFTPENTRRLLVGKSEARGNVLGALLGMVTPFCSCSAVPLFTGFVTAGVPLGVTFSFLIASPMVNELAIALLYALFGWEVAILYAVTGLSIAIVAGWIIGYLRMENQLQDWVQGQLSMGDASQGQGLTPSERIDAGVQAVRAILARVWLYIVVGIGLGAAIHGYVPQTFMAQIMGQGVWWSVPLAVLIGIPLYTNAAGMVPIVYALIGKGAALGTALAFMMSAIALSLPEMLLLKKVLKVRLLAVFVGTVAAGILLVGYLFNVVL